ncbi:MAG: alpha/beta hydrolase, partial [Planctomycetia bacterium]|nr:alpha/beta hydrolase [Planctomycetia bacterium]
QNMISIDINGARLNAADEGTGVPLLLVHGFPLDHTMWNAQVAAFAAHYRVIAPDLRGFGKSTGTADVLSMEQHADDLGDLLDVLGIQEPVHFCALSMGGYVAWQFWRRHATRLRSLILCDTKAAGDTPEGAKGRLAMADQVLREGAKVAAAAMLPKLLAADAPTRRPDLVEQVRQMILGNSPQTIAAAQRGMAQRPDVRAWLGDIRLPVQLIVGEQDVITPPAEMRGVAEAISGSNLAEIPGVGHMSPLEAPDAVNEVLGEFLERQE